MDFNSIDIFCHVVDNFGDIGVAWRFAREFKRRNPFCRTRLFVDEMEVFRKICPLIDPSEPVQEYESITCINSSVLDEETVQKIGVADILVEAFACQIPDMVMDQAFTKSKLLINLEHLSAEDWIEGYHLKESLLPRGTLKKYFFMPGFTSATGGIIINPELEKNKPELKENRLTFLNKNIEMFGKQTSRD